MLRTERVMLKTLKIFFLYAVNENSRMGLELSGSFALDSMGWVKWNDFYNSEQVTKWNVKALLWSLKWGEGIFFKCALFVLT